MTAITLICFRFHGHSERSISERSLSPDDRRAGRDKYNYPDRHKKAKYSPEYKRHDDTRSSTAASEGRRTRKRLVNMMRIWLMVGMNKHVFLYTQVRLILLGEDTNYMVSLYLLFWKCQYS